MNNISFITRAEAVSRMNEWGRRQVPFFFYILAFIALIIAEV